MRRDAAPAARSFEQCARSGENLRDCCTIEPFAYPTPDVGCPGARAGSVRITTASAARRRRIIT